MPFIPILFGRRKVIEKMPDNFILLTYKYGYMHLHDGFTFFGLLEYLKNNGIEVQNEVLSNRIDYAFGLMVFRNYQGGTFQKDDSTKYWMHNESYFSYLEYLEMSEAREGSAQAKRLSIWAIGVSAILAIIQIWIQLKQS